MERKRIFAAIDISEEARERVAAYQRSLRRGFPDISVRWEKPEKLHITVKFVGSIDETELERFSNRVDNAAREILPFSITFAETGTFVRRSSRANVLWLGLRSFASNGASEIIETLASKIDEGRSTKKFHPHLTIARLKDARKAKDLIGHHLDSVFEAVTFDAREMIVYESKLLPTGSVYTALSRHMFAATP